MTDPRAVAYAHHFIGHAEVRAQAGQSTRSVCGTRVDNPSPRALPLCPDCARWIERSEAEAQEDYCIRAADRAVDEANRRTLELIHNRRRP